MESYRLFWRLLKEVKRKKPLVHHITNYVTANDCANIVLALGGSPVMADFKEEVEEVVSGASCLVLNMGTLNEHSINSMILAGRRANELNIPVILDPVGVGAVNYRFKAVQKIISKVKLSVIKGNLSEIKKMCGMQVKAKGVDTDETVKESIDEKVNTAKVLARDLKCIIVITGEIDVITDGKSHMLVENGHKELSRVTGTGCMCTSLIGTYCGITTDFLIASAAGILTMGISGEKAYEVVERLKEGTGSFKIRLLDNISNFSAQDFEKRSRIIVKK